jgi:hypothetical protein
MYSVQGAASKDFQDVELDYNNSCGCEDILFCSRYFCFRTGPQYAFLVNDDFGNTIDN